MKIKWNNIRGKKGSARCGTQKALTQSEMADVATIPEVVYLRNISAWFRQMIAVPVVNVAINKTYKKSFYFLPLLIQMYAIICWKLLSLKSNRLGLMFHNFHFLRVEISPNGFSDITHLSASNSTMMSFQLVSFSFVAELIYKTTLFLGCVMVVMF